MLTADRINIRDPFVLYDGDLYYLYGTRGETCWGPASGFDVYTSTDLEHWNGPEACFENDGTFWADRNYWAPEVHRWKGRYYLFASFKTEGVCRGTAILAADSPKGPFQPWSAGKTVTPPDWECLDGTFYADRDGRPYMVFCHEWVQVGDGEVWALPLTDDLRQAAGEPVLLFRASEADWVKPVHHSSGITGYVTDGPFLWTDAGGRLLCLWSSFSEGGYTQGLAVSGNGTILSHFSQLPPLFTGDGGHGMLFHNREGKLLLALHSPNSHLQERPRFYEIPNLP